MDMIKAKEEKIRNSLGEKVSLEQENFKLKHDLNQT